MSMDVQQYSPEEGGSKEKRESHNEVERRRRNKMAVYVNELAEFLKKKRALMKRPERVNVLQCASDLMREYSEKRFDDFFLKKYEFEYFVFDVTKGFVIVVDCATGIINGYMKGVQTTVHNEDWIGTNIFDYVHSEDYHILKEQMIPDTIGQFLDLKTGTVRKEDSVPQYRAAVRTKRNFRIRIKYWQHDYCIVHCNGYIQNDSSENKADSHLVVFGKIITIKPNMRKHSYQDSFETVFDINGIITTTSGNMLKNLGYMTNHIDGQNFLKFVHPYDQQKFTNYFQHLLQNKGKEYPISYRLQGIDGKFTVVNCEGESLVNPCTEEVNFIVCKHWRDVDPSTTVQKPPHKVKENPVKLIVQEQPPVQKSTAFSDIKNSCNLPVVVDQNHQLQQQFKDYPIKNHRHQQENQQTMVQKVYYEKQQQQNANQQIKRNKIANPIQMICNKIPKVQTTTPPIVQHDVHTIKKECSLDYHDNTELYRNINNQYHQQHYKENTSQPIARPCREPDILMSTVQDTCDTSIDVLINDYLHNDSLDDLKLLYNLSA